MTSGDCEKCRSAAEAVGNKVQALTTAVATACGCEGHKLSQHSPGPVADDEVLYFVVCEPEGLIDGKLNPIFVQQIHKGGLSTLREDAQNEEFVTTFSELNDAWAGKGRSVFGVQPIKTSEARYVGSVRFMCVFDTAQPRKPHHADIMCPSQNESQSETMRKREMKQLTKKFIDNLSSGCIPLESFRTGALREFAGGQQPAS